MKGLFLVLVLILTCVAYGQRRAPAASHGGLVGNLKNKSLAEDCGCSFRVYGSRRDSDKFIFSSAAADDEKRAWMNIDGEDVALRLVQRMDPKGRERVGSRSMRKYVGEGIAVQISYVAVRVCKPNDENCESTDYSAILTVTKGGRKVRVRASGACGC